MSKSKTEPIDLYFHYDSKIIPLNDHINLDIPKEGYYHITLGSIYVVHKNILAETSTDSNPVYLIDNINGYFRLNGFSNEQIGNVRPLLISGGKRGIYFPLRDPLSKTPSSSVRNKIYLNAKDSFYIEYLNEKCKPQDCIKRLVLTIHITSID